jgi:hypothetical protein
MTNRWGWQPTAWLQNGLPTWRWRSAPTGLVTRRQMRDLGLAPGGAQPVAQVVCRRGRRRAWLYDPAELAPEGRDDNPTLGTGAHALDQSWHHGWLAVAAALTALIGTPR